MNPFWAIFTTLLFLYIYWVFEPAWRKHLLLLTNVLFLLILDRNFFAFHLALSLVTFFSIGLFQEKKKNVFLVAPVIFNIGALIYQKYRGTDHEMKLFSISLSYFTLMNLGYFFEVVKNQVTAERSFREYYLFTAFFPCILMGPIEKASHLLPQLQLKKEFRPTFLLQGLFLVSLGLFKKWVLSDRLVEITHPDNPLIQTYQGPVLWSFYLIALIQIYCDFSGYIDIARGVACAMGIDLASNFKRPYLSNSIANIWQRWNITLVDWMKNHVYLPLLFKTKNIYLSTVVIMLLVALWHGPSLMLLLWGIYWSILYSLHIFFRTKGIAIKSSFASIPLMILAMAFSTIFFHATDLKVFQDLLTRTFALLPSGLFLRENFFSQDFPVLIAGLLIIFVAEGFLERKKNDRPLLLFVASLLLGIVTVGLAHTESYMFLYMRY